MTGRRTLVLVGLLCLAALAGCLGPSEISDEDLQGNATYNWETGADAAYNLSDSSYQAVYEVTNRSSIAVYNRDALGVESPVQIEKLQFRFTNDTVVNATHANLSATLAQSETDITLPAQNGSVAYTASRNGKQFATPVIVPGNQSITLPPDARVGVPVLSHVRPGDYSTSITDARMTVRWANVTDGSLTVHYYLQWDLLLFGGLAAIGLALGLGGALYYFRQIRRLKARREEIGLDVNQSEDENANDR